LDAVSDRDFAIETIAALSILMMHLSRLCEELILWNSKEFGYVEMGDNVTTGSSIMPQKKNPDVAELVRGKTGRVYGSLMSLLTTMKALPLTYNKDMQEDKEPLFDAVDTALVSLSTLNTLMNNVTFKSDRMLKSLEGDFSTATDLADYLVRQGLPFRDAHEVVGKLVASCIAKGHGLEELNSGDLENASKLFAGAVASDLVAPQGSADGRTSYGGTGKTAVERQLANARDWLSKSS
jgi:argininosuccinate lyase